MKPDDTLLAYGLEDLCPSDVPSSGLGADRPGPKTGARKPGTRVQGLLDASGVGVEVMNCMNMQQLASIVFPQAVWYGNIRGSYSGCSHPRPPSSLLFKAQ